MKYLFIIAIATISFIVCNNKPNYSAQFTSGLKAQAKSLNTHTDEKVFKDVYCISKTTMPSRIHLKNEELWGYSSPMPILMKIQQSRPVMFALKINKLNTILAD